MVTKVLCMYSVICSDSPGAAGRMALLLPLSNEVMVRGKGTACKERSALTVPQGVLGTASCQGQGTRQSLMQKSQDPPHNSALPGHR